MFNKFLIVTSHIICAFYVFNSKDYCCIIYVNKVTAMRKAKTHKRSAISQCIFNDAKMQKHLCCMWVICLLLVYLLCEVIKPVTIETIINYNVLIILYTFFRFAKSFTKVCKKLRHISVVWN